VNKIFVFIICLKEIFWGTTKFGGTAPGYLPVATVLERGLQNDDVEKIDISNSDDGM